MMVASAMASYVINRISQINEPVRTNNVFYDAVCEYVEANAQVFYSWTAALPSPPYTPDPMVVVEAKIKTIGQLSPVMTNTPETTIAAWSAVWNANASTWLIIWPPSFALSPALVIPTISFHLSYATEQVAAVTSLCQDIINGLKLATPAAAGTHAAYVGAATFTSLI